jgi:hypothetical protein
VLAIVAALTASTGAYARVNQHNTAALAGAHASVSDTDIRKQCYAEARNRWPSTSQDVQTARDFAYRTCAFDHGVRNP